MAERAEVRSMTELYSLRAAEDAAERAATAKQEAGSANELRAALAAVLLAQASIEGHVHAFLENRLVPSGQKAAYDQIIGIPRIEERFEKGLRLTTKKMLDKGASPWQDFRLLRSIRNALIHYEPTWEGADAEPAKVLTAARSQKRFALNEQGSRWEEQILTSECAHWACATVVTMVGCIYDLVGAKKYPPGIAERLK